MNTPSECLFHRIDAPLTSSQIAATYGNDAAADALKRSSSYGVFADPYDKESSYSTAANPALTTATSRAPSTMSTGYNSHSGFTRPQSGVALFDRNRDSYVGTPNSGHFSPGLNPGQGYMDDDSRYGTAGGRDHDRDRLGGNNGGHGWAQ